MIAPEAGFRRKNARHCGIRRGCLACRRARLPCRSERDRRSAGHHVVRHRFAHAMPDARFSCGDRSIARIPVNRHLARVAIGVRLPCADLSRSRGFTPQRFDGHARRHAERHVHEAIEQIGFEPDQGKQNGNVLRLRENPARCIDGEGKRKRKGGGGGDRRRNGADECGRPPLHASSLLPARSRRRHAAGSSVRTAGSANAASNRKRQAGSVP